MTDQPSDSAVVVTIDRKSELVDVNQNGVQTYNDRVGGDPIPTSFSGRWVLIALGIFAAISGVIGVAILQGTHNEQLLENRLRIGDVLVVNDIVAAGPKDVDRYVDGLDDPARDYRNACRGVLLGWWDTLSDEQRTAVTATPIDVRLQLAGGNPSRGTIAFRLISVPHAVTIQPDVTMTVGDRELVMMLSEEWRPLTMVDRLDMLVQWRDVDEDDPRLIGDVIGFEPGVYPVTFSGTCVVGSGDERAKLPWVSDSIEVEIPKPD